ncbi:MAG: Holliday junction branch migration DNA helicase RuvB, partial [Acidobacteria bacterium]|nr:Holliday junction branch migration DNA helicase RuvB [Acidobacteriota bacterium]
MSAKQAPPGRRDEEFHQTLRPRDFGEYVGQTAVLEQLEISVGAARARGEALDHVLLHGPPGLGKTSLAAV